MNISRLSLLLATLLFVVPTCMITASTIIIIPESAETNKPTLVEKVKDAAHTVAEKAKDAAHTVADKAKELAHNTAHAISDKTK